MDGATTQPRIGVLGGTGEQGRGLAYRWAQAGLTVAVGSRDEQRAIESADEIGFGAVGLTNAQCAASSDVLLVAVPWAGHRDLLTELRDDLVGKIVIDCVNPLGFDKQGAFALAVDEGSAAQQAASILTESTVVAAFHHVSAVLLLDKERESIDTDVLVLGDDRDATGIVQELVDVIPGMRGVFGGRLRNAGQVEALTANLISVNRRYKTHSGIRLTGV